MKKIDVYLKKWNDDLLISSITKEERFNKITENINNWSFLIKKINLDNLSIEELYLKEDKYYYDTIIKLFNKWTKENYRETIPKILNLIVEFALIKNVENDINLNIINNDEYSFNIKSQIRQLLFNFEQFDNLWINNYIILNSNKVIINNINNFLSTTCNQNLFYLDFFNVKNILNITKHIREIFKELLEKTFNSKFFIYDLSYINKKIHDWVDINSWIEYWSKFNDIILSKEQNTFFIDFNFDDDYSKKIYFNHFLEKFNIKSNIFNINWEQKDKLYVYNNIVNLINYSYNIKWEDIQKLWKNLYHFIIKEFITIFWNLEIALDVTSNILDTNLLEWTNGINIFKGKEKIEEYNKNVNLKNNTLIQLLKPSTYNLIKFKNPIEDKILLILLLTNIYIKDNEIIFPYINKIIKKIDELEGWLSIYLNLLTHNNILQLVLLDDNKDEENLISFCNNNRWIIYDALKWIFDSNNQIMKEIYNITQIDKNLLKNKLKEKLILLKSIDKNLFIENNFKYLIWKNIANSWTAIVWMSWSGKSYYLKTNIENTLNNWDKVIIFTTDNEYYCEITNFKNLKIINIDASNENDFLGINNNLIHTINDKNNYIFNIKWNISIKNIYHILYIIYIIRNTINEKWIFLYVNEIFWLLIDSILLSKEHSDLKKLFKNILQKKLNNFLIFTLQSVYNNTFEINWEKLQLKDIIKSFIVLSHDKNNINILDQKWIELYEEFIWQKVIDNTNIKTRFNKTYWLFDAIKLENWDISILTIGEIR